MEAVLGRFAKEPADSGTVSWSIRGVVVFSVLANSEGRASRVDSSVARPFGARHDFEWQGKSIEIKTTVSTRGRIHKVNGIDQLRPPEHGELLFFSLRVREEASAANTLPKLVG